MKYGVFGPKQNDNGEIYNDLAYLSACLDTLPSISCLITGGARGVETVAASYAADKGIKLEKVPPNFHNLFGSTVKNPNVKIDDLSLSLRHQIFAARNDEIIVRSDRVVVFWDGEFFEIGQLVRRAIALRKPVLLFPV